MKKVEVLAIVKEEIGMITQVFETHCKHCNDDITREELETYRNYAIGKLRATINIWVRLEMGYLEESGKGKENLKRAGEIREIEKDLEDNIRAMFEKKLDEIE